MSVVEEPPANGAPALGSDAVPDSASAVKPDDHAQTATAGQSPDPADNTPAAHGADHGPSATSGLPENHAALSQTTSVNPFDTQPVVQAEDTPALPARPEATEHAMATATATQGTPVAPGADATPQEERLNPQVESLHAMFPDFDVAIL